MSRKGNKSGDKVFVFARPWAMPALKGATSKQLLERTLVKVRMQNDENIRTISKRDRTIQRLIHSQAELAHRFERYRLASEKKYEQLKLGAEKQRAQYVECRKHYLNLQAKYQAAFNAQP